MISTGFDLWHVMQMEYVNADLAHTDCYELVFAELEYRSASSLHTDDHLRELMHEFRFDGFSALTKFSDWEYFEHHLSFYLRDYGDGIMAFAKRHHGTLRKLGFLPIDATDEQLSYEELEKAIQNLVSHCLNNIFNRVELQCV